MIVVDTMVLAYAVGSAHPLKEPSERLFEAVSAGSIHASTTTEVIQEFAHIRSRSEDRRAATRAARAYTRVLSPLLVTTEEVLERGLAIYERAQGLGAFDAVLAACALAHEADALVSADAAFGEVPRLRHVVLGSPEFDSLVPA